MATQKNIQLYIHTDGVNDTPFYGSDCSGNINNGDGNTLITNCEQIEIGAFKYDAKRMGGLPTISFTLYYPSSLEGLWNENIYGLFNGRKFFLKQTPSEKISNDNLMYEYSVELVDERIILDNTYFFNAVTKGDTEEYDQPITNNTTFNFYGDINKFAKMLNSSLRYSKLQTVDDEGKKKGYVVIVDDGIVTEEKFVSFSKVFFSSAIQESYNTFEIPYYFVGKEIHFGYKAAEITYPFQYGIDDAGLSISKQNANTRSINRATGTGSSENIPFYYPNKSPKGDLGVDVNTTSSDFSVTVKDNAKFADKVSVNDEIRAVNGGTMPWSSHGGFNLNEENRAMMRKDGKNVSKSTTIQFATNKAGYVRVKFSTIVNRVVVRDGSTGSSSSATVGNIDIRHFKCVARNSLYDNYFHNEEYDRTINEDGSINDVTFDMFVPMASEYNYVTFTQSFVNNNRNKEIDVIFTCSLDFIALDYEMVPDGDKLPVENWMMGDKIVYLNDLGLDYSGTPKVGDTIRQKVLRYITPSDVLLPPKYRLTDGRERFYNALNNTYTIDGEQISFVKPYIDGKPRENIYENDNIKPSIIGAINAQGLRIDMFSEIAFDEGDNDETYTDDENGDVNYVHPYFFAKLRKLPFNLFDQALEDGGAMTIEFTSGRCGACKFEIAVDDESKENTVQVYESDTLVNGVLHPKGSLKYDENGRVICGVKKFQDAVTHRQEIQNDTKNNEVWIALRKEDSTYGVLIPNAEANYKPSSCSSSDTNDGDTFIITNIKLPDEYIEAAEKRLEDYIIASMAKDNPEKFNFSIDLSRIFFEEHQELLSQLDENSSIGVMMDGVVYSQFVSTYSYIMGENDILPEIKITLVDSLSVSTNAIQKIASQVNMNMLNALNSVNFMALVSPYFLRKDQDDEAEGRVNFKRGLKFGEGGKIEIMPDNGAKLTIDYLEVNKKATFNALEIAESRHVGGQLLITPAGMKCGEVEELDDAYRCYFQTKEGDIYKIFNQFVVGDQAICQTYNEYGSKYYWRLITAIGEDYIDLSKTDIDEESDIPEVGDTIVQLGNRDDISRQCAIVISTYDDTAPSIIMYHGINSFSLEGKNMTGIIWNPETKEPQMYSYGSFFFGDRELKNNFITFQKKEGDTDKNLYINGKVTIGAGSAGLSNLEEWSDKQTQINNAQATANDAKQKAEDAQSRAGVLESTTSNLSTQITDLENNVTDTVEEINKRLDGVVENYFEEGVPTLENYPAKQWKTDDEKKNHIGDTFTNINTYEVDPDNAGKSWRWVASDAEHSGYHWHPIADSDAVKALQDAAKAQSTADGKSTTFLRQPTNYSKGDLWVLQSDNDHTTGKKGEILTANTSSAAYNASHWSKEIIYTDDSKVNSFINGEFADYKTQIQSQVDKKAQTWYQSTDPSSSWTTEEKQEHIGDMWLNSSSLTISGIESGMTAIWNGTEWKPSEVPQEVFNKIDGKAQVFVSVPTTPYRIGDLWASSDNRLMKCKTTRLTGAFASSDWENADNSREYADAIGTEIHNTFDYLKAAMAQDTTIEGGLVQTSVLSLGYTDASGIRHVMSGTNGIYDSSLKGGGIAAWYGGLMVDREAPNAVIDGAAASLHRFDGSGYFAKGNISWDADGAIKFAGGQLSITKNGALILGNDIAFGSNGDETIQSIISKLSIIMTWFQQYDENTIYTPFNFVTGRQIAAAQAGTASGGGTGSLIFTGPWSDYTSEKSDYALAASLGYDLHNRVITLEGKAVNVSFVQSLSAGKQIGTISIDGKSTNLYAPSTYAWNDVTGKPAFATVATSGSYNDLFNKPSIPSIAGLASESWVRNNFLGLGGGTIIGNITMSNSRIKMGYDAIEMGSGMLGAYTPSYPNTLFWYDGAGWQEVLHKGNFNSYAPTLTGTGASGTWRIDISGTADKLLTADSIAANYRGPYNFNYNLYTGYWGSNQLGYATSYGQYIDLSGRTTWYNRLAFNTNGVIEFFQGINTTTLSKIGDLAYTSSNVASSTNSDMLDGYHENSFVRRDETQGYLGHFELNNIPRNVTQVGSIGWADWQLYPYAGGMWLTLKGVSSLRTLLIFFPSYKLEAEPILYSSVDNGEWGYKHTLAYLTSNVASATKLQTARTIWGQSFDGTDNVSGALSGVGAITPSADTSYNIGNSSNQFMWVYANGVYAKSGSWFGLGANNADHIRILTNGNVGIGTIYPQYKLDVNGTVRFGTGYGCDVWLNRISGNSYINAVDSIALTTGNNSSNIAFELYANKSAMFYGALSVSGATTLSSTLSVSGMATLGAITSNGLHNLICYENEFTFIPDSYGGVVFLNYRTASSSLNGNISEYIFCKGSGPTYSGIRCGNLYATGGTLTIGSATLTWNGTALVVDKPLVSTSFAAGATATASSSDMRLKTVTSEINLGIEEIANAPLFNYYLNEHSDKFQMVGSSAQYWKECLPKSVVEDGSEDNYLSLFYDRVAIASAISVAREVVRQRNRIEVLEQIVSEQADEIKNLKTRLNS